MKIIGINAILYISIWIIASGCQSKDSGVSDKDRIKSADTTSHENIETTPRSGYADVNGIKMYYEIYGHGKPLVLIHGGGSTIQSSFERIIPGLAKDRQVIGV